MKRDDEDVSDCVSALTLATCQQQLSEQLKFSPSFSQVDSCVSEDELHLVHCCKNFC